MIEIRPRYMVTTLLVFIMLQGSGQSWAETDAKWHYSYSNLTYQGYVEIFKTGDTLISGITCDKLVKTRYGFDYVTMELDTTVLGTEYTYYSNDTVYNYRQGQFYPLYDFGASVGDTWTIRANYDGIYCTDTLGTVRVDSIGTVNINGDNLRYLWVNDIGGTEWTFYGGRVIEKLGCETYMFPEPICVTDVHEGGPLRCYNDVTGWSYNSGTAPACDFIITSVWETAMPSASVHPNIVVDFMNYNLDQSYLAGMIKVHSIAGELLREENIHNTNDRIDLSFLAPGFYLIAFQNKQHQSFFKFLKN